MTDLGIEFRELFERGPQIDDFHNRGTGVMEWWNNGVMPTKTPSVQYSNTPSLQFSITPILL
jgi:hypothetical protein